MQGWNWDSCDDAVEPDVSIGVIFDNCPDWVINLYAVLRHTLLQNKKLDEETEGGIPGRLKALSFAHFTGDITAEGNIFLAEQIKKRLPNVEERFHKIRQNHVVSSNFHQKFKIKFLFTRKEIQKFLFRFHLLRTI